MNISIPAVIEEGHPIRKILTASETRWTFGEIWLQIVTGSGWPDEPMTELVRRHVRLMLERRKEAWEKIKQAGRPAAAVRDELNRNLDEQEVLEKFLRYLSPPVGLVREPEEEVKK